MRYSNAVLDRVRDPKFVGALPKDERNVGTGEAGTLDEGSMARIQIRMDGDGVRIADAVFKVFGCSAAIASASFVAERLQGASLSQARSLEPMVVAAELQLPIERAHVAAMAVRAAHAAIEDWERKQSQTGRLRAADSDDRDFR
ncbi:MAG TPA: iron-sulfur cluster assembly scaffold protein [Vicinamibacterales bacterium]|nr:iron-sulfur cluster assembly scaffold protein [Vicinamibacterales bacterium]